MNNIITSEAKFRQRVIKYSYKHGVTKASRIFHRSRNAIYEWRKKYDGKDMILRRYPRYKDDLIMLWDSLRKDGYTRSYTSLVRVVRNRYYLS